MSEQLKDFGARAETLVEIPDFAEIDRRGRGLRVRRRASVAAALAAVLAVAGVTVAQSHRSDADRGPVTRPHPSAGARPYQGPTMKTLKAGTYQLRPSLAQSALVTEFSVPKGWNSWVGPNRFDGHARGRTNGEALGHLTWYVGALVLEVNAVNTHGCDNPDLGNVSTVEDLVAALRRTLGFQVIHDPEPVHRFGYQASRMRVRITNAIEDCGESSAVFDTTTDGPIQYGGVGWIADIWVVDVDGSPIYVQKIWSPNAPRQARSELDSVISSIRFAYLEDTRDGR